MQGQDQSPDPQAKASEQNEEGNEPTAAQDVDHTSRPDGERDEGLQSRFDEEYQGEAWKINENTEGKDD